MPWRKAPPTEIDEQEILDEFAQDANNYSTFAPSDSDFMAIHAGSLTLKGGIFAYAANDGLLITTAFPAMSDDEKGMAVYHLAQHYPEVVGELQKSPISRGDRDQESILWLAGKELYNQDKHVLGAFVLMATERDLSPDSRTLLLPFASKAIGKVIRETEEEALSGEIPATEEQKQLLKTVRADERYDEKIEGIAMHTLAGFFPRTRKFRRLLGL